MISLILAFQYESRFLEKVLKDLAPKANELIVALAYEPSEGELRVLAKYPYKLVKVSKMLVEEGIIQRALQECKGDWILMMRENEYMDNDALKMIDEKNFKEDAYAFRRKTFLRGLDDSIFLFFDFPNPQIRLFKKKCKWDVESNSIIGFNSCRYVPGHIVFDNLNMKLRKYVKTLPIINSSINFLEMGQ